MDQFTARRKAKELDGVASTLCAFRGEFEEGPDANVWVVVKYGEIVAGDRAVGERYVPPWSVGNSGPGWRPKE